jgi:hypothetical protein
MVALLAGGNAQNISGSWYGRADVMLEGSHNNYLTELVLKQKGREVEGIMGYYFKNRYQSFFVRGTFDESTRMVEFKNLPILYFRSDLSKSTVNCIMDFQARLVVSKIGSTLNGNFLRDEKYKYTCPDLDISFTRDVSESNPDSLLRNAVVMTRVWQPMKDEIVVTPAMVEAISKASPDPIVSSFNERKTFLINEIEVDADSLRVTLYDNGDIDGDTISIFYNRIPIAMKQGLSAQGTNLYIGLDPKVEVHEISLYAENLGTNPPNTALMIIYDGSRRHEMFSTSNLNMNGTIKIRKKKTPILAGNTSRE